MGTLIGEKDFALFKSVTKEVQRLAGIEVFFYHFDVKDMKRPDGSSGYDPLYGEKVCDSTWGITGQGGVTTQGGLGKPYIILGIFEHDDKNIAASERGRTLDSATNIWFVKEDFDLLGIGQPMTGDIVRYRTGDITKYRDWWWNINKVSGDGWIDMSHKNFTLYKCDIAYNTKLSASVKVDDLRLNI